MLMLEACFERAREGRACALRLMCVSVIWFFNPNSLNGECLMKFLYIPVHNNSLHIKQLMDKSYYSENQPPSSTPLNHEVLQVAAAPSSISNVATAQETKRLVGEEMLVEMTGKKQ